MALREEVSSKVVQTEIGICESCHSCKNKRTHHAGPFIRVPKIQEARWRRNLEMVINQKITGEGLKSWIE